MQAPAEMDDLTWLTWTTVRERRAQELSRCAAKDPLAQEAVLRCTRLMLEMELTSTPEHRELDILQYRLNLICVLTAFALGATITWIFLFDSFSGAEDLCFYVTRAALRMLPLLAWSFVALAMLMCIKRRLRVLEDALDEALVRSERAHEAECVALMV